MYKSYINPEHNEILNINYNNPKHYYHDNPETIPHIYSLKLLKSPWVVIPIKLWVNSIVSMKITHAGRLINIEEHEIKVRKELLSIDLTQKLWDMSSECNKKDWEYEEHRSIFPYFCFNGADYITSIFCSQNPGVERITISEINDMFPDIDAQKIPINMLYDLNGVFKCIIDLNIEGHGFVIYARNDIITVYCTYGGHIGMFITDFSKKSWIDNLINLENINDIERQYELYGQLWGFRKNMLPSIYYNLNKPKVQVKSLIISRIY